MAIPIGFQLPLTTITSKWIINSVTVPFQLKYPRIPKNTRVLFMVKKIQLSMSMARLVLKYRKTQVLKYVDRSLLLFEQFGCKARLFCLNISDATQIICSKCLGGTRFFREPFVFLSSFSFCHRSKPFVCYSNNLDGKQNFC